MRIDTLKDLVARDEEGVIVPMLDPHEEPYTASDGTPTTFSVLGKQSSARRTAEDTESKRWLGRNVQKLDPADLRARRLNLAAACVNGQTGWEDENNRPIAYSPAIVKTILATDERILEQVETAIDKHSLLFPTPSSK